ncbi:MAG TPA: ParB/RepB/Spo0J family partition protein [Phycisphaerales bacterium]|nr:ParB/RepB/Spo0J family partition protein [Phycisphaerales bacterium]
MDAKKGAAVEVKSPARRLGRGLSSLLALDTPAVPVAVETQVVAAQEHRAVATPANGEGSGLSDFQSIAVAVIEPSRYQPRKVIDDAAIARLAESIKRAGVMQPVIVRPIAGGRYELVAGERRWRAATAAGLEKIPALVRPMSDEQSAEWGLVENVQREDLNPMERAWALKALGEKFNLPQQQLAERVGLERSTVANLIRLCELEPEIAQMIVKGELSAGHGKALLAAPAGPQRVGLAREAHTFNYSVRKLESIAAKVGERKAKGGKADPMEDLSTRYAHLRDLERQIGQQLGTKVQILTTGSGKRGRLCIEFYGLDHFDGLLQRLNVRAH